MQVFFLQLFILFLCAALSACTHSEESSETRDKAGEEAHASSNGAGSLTVSSNVAKHMQFAAEKIEKRVLGEDLHMTGRIRPYIGKEADVAPRFSGRVLEVNVKPGQAVHQGQVLALIDSHELASLQGELIEAQSKLRIAEAQQERERLVYEENIQRPKSLIEAKTHFESTKVHLELVESDHKRIEGLYKAKIAAAKDFLAAAATLAKAKLEFKEAQTQLAREESLYKNRALLRRDLQLAEAETLKEKNHFTTLQQRLEVSGMAADMIKALLKTGKIVMTLPIRSGVDGVVTHQDVSVGELVGPDKHLFTITDLSTVVVIADLPEVESNGIKIGDTVKVRIPSMPGKVFTAKISWISDMVNAETRTVPIRATLENKERNFKINMFADIELRALPQTVLACPKSAVQDKDGNKIVFVQEGDRYVEKRVELGRDDEKYSQIISGLQEGEQVVTTGSLMLKTEMSYKN